ncbi:hypothetical protein Plhal304r1_c087g0170021 [Plasmopara halstedii]
MLKIYVVGRILTGLTCHPPSCTKVGTSTIALNRRPCLRVCCVMLRTSSTSKDTYRLLPGSTLRVRRQGEKLDLSSWVAELRSIFCLFKVNIR